MAKLRLLKTGHGDLTLAEWDKDQPETVADGGDRLRRAFHGRPAGVPARRAGRTTPIRQFERTAAEILIVPAIQGAESGMRGLGSPPGDVMIRTGYLRWEIEVQDSAAATTSWRAR